MTAQSDPRFRLRVAASASAPATARLFVGAVLRLQGYTEDILEDARLAISELVTAAVSDDRVIDVEVVFDVSTIAVTPVDLTSLDTESRLVIDALFASTQQADTAVVSLPSPSLR
jgi:hypothetical protein